MAVDKRLIGVPSHTVWKGSDGGIQGTDADEDDGAHPGAVLQDRRKLMRQAWISDDDLVLSMIDDVLQLVIHQLLVERVEHRTHARDGKEGLQMLGTVVHECAYALIVSHIKFRAQRMCQRGGTCSDLSEGCGLLASIIAAGHGGISVNL